MKNKMTEQEKNEQALKQLGIEIPEGWEFVRYGLANRGELYIDSDYPPQMAEEDFEVDFVIVVKNKIKTECWYLVEDEDGYVCVMFLGKDMKWKTYNNIYTDLYEFKHYKIISKMVEK